MCGRELADAELDRFTGEPADGALDVGVVGRQRRLELGVVEVEQGTAGRAAGGGDGRAVLLDRRLLELGVAVEAEGLREADDRRRGRVGAAGELLRCLEGRLLEVVDDVSRSVLLRARELVEALGDVGREGLAVRGPGSAGGAGAAAAGPGLGCGLAHR
jgi:hypothetical protein